VHINRVIVKNYRAIRSASVEFHKGLNVIVGGNEVGKSTLLEAINAALSGQIGGRSIRDQLHPYLFNRKVAEEYPTRSGRDRRRATTSSSRARTASCPSWESLWSTVRPASAE
jgi:predicted ATP-dependent endonuclease of OLD family